MTWNHRVMRYTTIDPVTKDKDLFYGIHEVYNVDGELQYTAKAVPITGETPEELRELLNWMLKALDAPILDYKDD
jgi:hypothetical protein